MKAKEFRDKTLDQLDDELVKLKKEQFNLRFQRATGQLENTSRVREVRRDIARLKTVARQKRAGEPPKVAAAPAAVAAPKRSSGHRRPLNSNRSKPSLKSRAKAKRK